MKFFATPFCECIELSVNDCVPVVAEPTLIAAYEDEELRRPEPVIRFRATVPEFVPIAAPLRKAIPFSFASVTLLPSMLRSRT